MPAKLLLQIEAVNDIQEAVRYYNRIQPSLGRRFEQEIKHAFRKIKQAPHTASFAFDTVRYKVIDKFPFIILYKEIGSQIVVARVFNTHQNPDVSQ